MDIKSISTIIATTLTLVSYIPYFLDTLKGKTKPHLFTWIVWVVINLTNFLLFLRNGGGGATIIMLTVLLITSSILVASFKNGAKDIKRSDVLFLALSVISFALWFSLKDATYSALLATSTSLIALVPTIRKSWSKPHSETLSTYTVNTIRHLLVLSSVETLSLVTIFNPLAWSLFNGIFALILITRRKAIKK